MATASIPLTQIEDITECPICSEIFVDSRVLPCIHTYCLRCITSLGKDKKPGDEIPCPLCRKEFAIPEGGMSKLPKNYFVEKLLEVKNLANMLCHEDSLCDVCADDGEVSERKTDRKAVVYCIGCHKNMCKQCYACHQQFKLPGNHKVIDRNKSPMPVDDLLLRFPETYCDKHPDKCLELYCFECKTTICLQCRVTGHDSHKCSDVKDVADDKATSLTANAEGIKAKIKDCESMQKKISDEERVLVDKVTETEKVINEKADKLKTMIDRHREEALSKLTTAKTRQVKENENVNQELERQIVIMESFIRYTEELKQRGTACDIASTADELRIRGEELLKFDVEVDLPVDFTLTNVKFEAMKTLSESDYDIKRVFGELDITVDVKGKQSLHIGC